MANFETATAGMCRVTDGAELSNACMRRPDDELLKLLRKNSNTEPALTPSASYGTGTKEDPIVLSKLKDVPREQLEQLLKKDVYYKVTDPLTNQPQVRQIMSPDPAVAVNYLINKGLIPRDSSSLQTPSVGDIARFDPNSRLATTPVTQRSGGCYPAVQDLLAAQGKDRNLYFTASNMLVEKGGTVGVNGSQDIVPGAKPLGNGTQFADLATTLKNCPVGTVIWSVPGGREGMGTDPNSDTKANHWMTFVGFDDKGNPMLRDNVEQQARPLSDCKDIIAGYGTVKALFVPDTNPTVLANLSRIKPGGR